MSLQRVSIVIVNKSEVVVMYQHERIISEAGEILGKRLVRTVLIFTESSDQLSRATDRVPGLPASPGYAQ